VDDRERLRLRMTGEVAKLLKNRSLRDALPPLGVEGTIPFVVGLPDDSLREITEKVAALGGEAHVIVPSEISTSGPFRVRILRVSEVASKPIADLDESCECAVDENSTLAMLMEHIEVGGVVTYYTYDSETVIRFINDSMQPIPALCIQSLSNEEPRRRPGLFRVDLSPGPRGSSPPRRVVGLMPARQGLGRQPRVPGQRGHRRVAALRREHRRAGAGRSGILAAWSGTGATSARSLPDCQPS
jgi:hypothetical protein